VSSRYVGRVKTTLNLPSDAAEALRSLASARNTSMSEVVRRAISLEKYMHAATRAGSRFLLEDNDKSLKELIFLEDSSASAASKPPDKSSVTARIAQFSPEARPSTSWASPPTIRIEIVPFGEILAAKLRDDPTAIHNLTPDEFEQFVCERLFAMGFEPKRIGRYNQRDGGIDVLFWPKVWRNFPFLGAAQVKHHTTFRNVSPPTVREFAAVIANHPINAGLIVTNTSFTPDARWFAQERAKLLRLRDFEDIKRWIENDFASEQEWREIPASIELAPGLVVKLNRDK
jgi:Restriction endonuclease/Ribbon-helix-helix protein, copG family